MPPYVRTLKKTNYTATHLPSVLTVLELQCRGPSIVADDSDVDRREKSKNITIEREIFLTVRLPLVDDEEDDLFAYVERFFVWHPNKPELVLACNSTALYLLHVHSLKDALSDSNEDMAPLLEKPSPEQHGIAVLPTMKDETVTCAAFTSSGSHLIYGTTTGQVRIMAMPRVKSSERLLENAAKMAHLVHSFGAFDMRYISAIHLAPYVDNDSVFVVASQYGDRILLYNIRYKPITEPT